jgi:MFS family permease
LATVFSQAWDGLSLVAALILMGGGIGINMTSTSTLLISASPPELSGEVGGLRGTAANLGTALGTALVGAVLISTLATSASTAVLSNAVLKPEFKQKLNPDSVTFVSNAQLEAITTKIKNLSERERQELVQINQVVRAEALQRSSLFMAAVALLAWGFTYPLPNRLLSGEISGARRLGG